MPESGTYGSVRGVPGNRHPYRDRGQPLAFHSVKAAEFFGPQTIQSRESEGLFSVALRALRLHGMAANLGDLSERNPAELARPQ